eukprot:CAMPEP_0118632080 /NCGR_PEP_ID=MMETSP0785-20121206/248_1 /TAXON_ID=91992 /ORGANISM="Bolidomonas pacifica, Strain CCMP 1866" /LENGTH=1362 /DNA_ID=CAMNT_0006522815 /DNA_START=272 /DNA_END=4358 /DNA_ORIENTATION=-
MAAQPPHDPNFGLPPEEVPHDWEFNIGDDTFKRVVTVGRSNLDFLARMEGETATGGDDQNGKTSLELRDGGEIDEEEARKERAKRLKAAGIKISDEDILSDDDESKKEDSDDSDDDSSVYSASEAPNGPGGAANEEEEDENNMLDNDWDTSEWTMQEIESACQTLVRECELKSSKKRQELSIRMLIRLLDRHQEAVAYIEKVSESLLNKAFPGILVDGIAPEALNLSHCLAALAPRFADSFSLLGPIARVCKILTNEMDLAAQLLQWRYKVRRLKRELYAIKDDIAPDRWIRKKMTLNMKSDDLNKKWRQMHDATHSSSVPPDVTLSHLKFLLALCTPSNTKHASENRDEVVKKHGLLPICLCLKEVGEDYMDPVTLDSASVVSNRTGSTATVSLGALGINNMGLIYPHQVACKLVLQISQERCLLYPLLRARIHEGLSKILAHQPILPAEDICMALDAMDMIGSNALKSSNVAMSEEDYVAYEQEKRSRLFHDENYVDSDADDCPSDVEDEGEKAIYRRETRKAIINLLVLPSIVSKLTLLLEVPHAQIFLGSVMVLHKFASTQAYNHVLIEIISLAGRPLEKIVENLPSGDDKICLACLNLLKQLSTRQAGRDGMVTSKIADMLMPLISGQDATPSKVFTLALNVFVALAQDGVTENVGLDLNGPPPKQVLYDDLLRIFTTPGSSPTVSIEHLLDLKVMNFVINFLVRPENTALYFNLTNQHKQMGAIILHRIFLHKECCRTMPVGPAMQYLAYNIQHMFTFFMEGHFGHTTKEKLIFFGSIQGSCRGLAQIAKYSPDGDMLVMRKIGDMNIYKEIEELLSFPSVRMDDSYVPKIECSDAAARLVGSIARVPVSERNPEADKESTLSLKDDVDNCLKTLNRLIEQMAKPLMAIVHGCPSKSAVANATSALANLCSTNATCDALLDMGLAKIAASLFPDKPSILEGAKGMKNIEDEIYDVQARDKRDNEVAVLLDLDASAFTLVASLCRTPAGKHAVQTTGMLRRCVERFHLDSGVKGVDLVVRGEISGVFAKIANTHTIESGNAGSTNDYILNPNYNTVRILIELVREGGNTLFYRRSRYWATAALAELCHDTMRAVPLIVKFGGVVEFSRVIKGFKEGRTPEPLLRPALTGMFRIAKYPLGGYVGKLFEEGMQQPLVAIASNVRLRMDYADVLDRTPLGDFAKDILFCMSEAKLHSGNGGFGGMGEDDSVGEVKRMEETKWDKDRVDMWKEMGVNEDVVVAVQGQEEEEEEDYGEELEEEGVDEGEEGGEEKKAGDAIPLDGTYASMGVSTMGSLAAELPNESAECAQTRVSKLDAEDPRFRNELRRRKEYYEMGSSYRLHRGGEARKSVTEKGTKSSD